MKKCLNFDIANSARLGNVLLFIVSSLTSPRIYRSCCCMYDTVDLIEDKVMISNEILPKTK